MADTLQVGARVNFFIAGVPAEWFTKAQVSNVSNSQEIVTANEGYVGESPSTPMVEVSVDYAVPKSGANLGTFWNYVHNGSFVPAQFNCGGAKYTGTGKVTQVQVSGGVNETTSGSFSWRGPSSLMKF